MHSQIHSDHLSKALHENHILGELDVEILNDLHNEIELVMLKKGDRLVAQGDPSDSLYIVVSGQLRVFEKFNQKSDVNKSEFDGSSVNYSSSTYQHVVDIGRGQTVGEIGFLSGEPRSASVFALRDTLTGRLDTDAYYKLLQRYPQPLTQLFSSRILGRLVNPPKKKNRTFALIGICSKDCGPLPIDELAKRLCWHFENRWSRNKATIENVSAGYVNEKSTDLALGENGISNARIDSSAHLRIQNWLNEQESLHEYVVHGANNRLDQPPTSWITRISQQVDHVIFVASADADLSTIEIPHIFESNKVDLPLNPACSLLLLHPENSAMPKRTESWLSKISVDRHHHVRWSDSATSKWKDPAGDIARVSRLLTQQGIGLVLSGGAARGFAHIGVVRALHEAGVPIDLFGGASAGAISASIIAAGHNDDQARDLVLKYGKRKNMNDYTLPTTALFKGKRFSALLRDFVGDVKIEDLWTPFYCVSINLADASEVVHRRGPLWKYVRASASLPIMLPPVADEGRLLADGASLNGMPVEIMGNDPGCGTVIGIDVCGGTGMRGEFTYGTDLSGWWQLIKSLNPFSKPYRSSALSTMIMASTAIGAVGRLPMQRARADLYIRPPVHKFKFMDYESRDQIMEAGYQAAKTEIAIWLEQDSVQRSRSIA